jgi:hypothetical protein
MSAEPVAWMSPNGMVHLVKHEDFTIPLYMAPSKREWVGLTDDEIWDCYTDQGKRFYLAIEAKLKEKNT